MTRDISPCCTGGILLGNDASGSMALPAFAFSGVLLCDLRVARSDNQHGGMEGNVIPGVQPW